MSEVGAAFDALEEEFFSVWFRYHPDLAVEAGVQGYEHLLPAHSDDELAALGGWLETLVVALEELDYAALDEERQVDLLLMFGAARVEHRELLERDWRHRDPLRFLPVGEIYRLTLQPPENVSVPLSRLLESVPEYLRLALAHLRPMAELIPRDLVVAAADEAERGRCYLRELVKSPWLRRNCRGISEIGIRVDDACSALSMFAEGLRGEIRARAAGRLGCGEDYLQFLFKHRHFVATDPEAARLALVEAFQECTDELVEICGRMGLAAEGAWHHLAAQRVGNDARLELCRRESERLEAFLRRIGLFSLPKASLRIGERPACPRPERLGADYFADRAAGGGVFFLGAVDQEPATLLRARCLESTWGGAHLLSWASGTTARRLPRRLYAGGAFAAAWGLYLRERLVGLGYLDREDHLLAVLQRRAAIARALLDLDLHMGSLDGAQALLRLQALTGADQLDLVFLARHPGSSVAGVLGWQAMKRARAASMELDGGAFSEGAFHDRLLARGPIPISLALSPASDVGRAPSRAPVA